MNKLLRLNCLGRSGCPSGALKGIGWVPAEAEEGGRVARPQTSLQRGADVRCCLPSDGKQTSCEIDQGHPY